jgi:Biotin-protein ligase, N terminal
MGFFSGFDLKTPPIAIYTGRGSSHSWLWFVDLFERFGLLDLSFLNEDLIRAGALNRLSVLALSGGDTFALAEGLGAEGASRIEDWVRQGGLYLGSCAGAYLPLRSSKKPLDRFNFVEARINNLTAVPYGCSFIFHPVREAVRISANGQAPFAGAGTFPAPLYGGPAMLASDPVEPLAYYSGFTEKTVFLVDQELARETLIGKAAVIRKRMGSGSFYLCGPHLEHPYFHKANQLLIDTIGFEQPKKSGPADRPAGERTVLDHRSAAEWNRAVKRELSNTRIVVSGIEQAAVVWKIGTKTYEPLKMRVFLETLWKRLVPLEKVGRLIIPERSQGVIDTARSLTETVRRLKIHLDRKEETTPLAEEIFQKLTALSRDFLAVYFETRRNFGL